MIYVLFGPPGVGKTYIGELISRRFGIGFFDADSLLDSDVKKKIRAGEFSQKDRNIFFTVLKKTTKYLLNEHPKLVIAESFIKEINRTNFIKNFPETKFVFVHCPYKLAKARALKRFAMENHTIDNFCFDWLWEEFDIPKMIHINLDNFGKSDNELIDEFTKQIEGT